MLDFLQGHSYDANVGYELCCIFLVDLDKVFEWFVATKFSSVFYYNLNLRHWCYCVFFTISCINRMPSFDIHFHSDGKNDHGCKKQV